MWIQSIDHRFPINPVNKLSLAVHNGIIRDLHALRLGNMETRSRASAIRITIQCNFGYNRTNAYDYVLPTDATHKQVFSLD